MSESQNTKVEKDGKTSKGQKVVKAPEPSKSDRLDRMEANLQLIEEGLLVLINSTQWANLSITPIGTHNPDLLIDGYSSLQDAVTALAYDGVEQIAQ